MKVILATTMLVWLAILPARAQDFAVPPPDGMGGVGMALATEGDTIVVLKVMENSPAAASQQIHEKDRVLAVGQGEEPAVSITGKTITECVAMIRGEAGTVVRLTVLPEGAPASMAREVMLTRDDLTNPLGLALDATLLKIGTAAPELRYVRLADGKATSLAEAHRGQVVVVEFWATWCAPCQEAVAALQKVAAKHAAQKGRIAFLNIAIDGDSLTAKGPAVLDKVSTYAKQQQWSQTTNGWSSIENRRNWYVAAVPTTYVVGTDGKIMAVNPDPKQLEEVLASAAKP